jgi:hypothetical protein
MNTSMTRRQMMRCGLVGASGLLLADRLGLVAAEQPAAAPPKGKAKAVIHVWLGGGPSQLDTFDPKPEAGAEYCGPYGEVVETNVPGIRINATLPLLAKQADKYAIIRSATHTNAGHEDGPVWVLTGRKPGGKMAYPCIGAVVSALRGADAGYRGKIPPFIVLTENYGVSPCYCMGFLDSRYGPFMTGGDPSETPWTVEGVIAPGISDERQRRRRDFLAALNTLGRAVCSDPQRSPLAPARAEAYDMILGEGRKVFDLSAEPDAVRDRYGHNKFGQSCLAARRLIEAGVLWVTVNPRITDGPKRMNWDNHRGDYYPNQLEDFDQGLSALLEDLAGRGLLESTIVWCGGEYGRAPKWDAAQRGRAHWPKCFSFVLAGGGFKGGRVVGASDEIGGSVKERPVWPCDVTGSLYRMLGMDLDTNIPHPRGERVPVFPAADEGEPSAGILKEIM